MVFVTIRRRTPSLQNGLSEQQQQPQEQENVNFEPLPFQEIPSDFEKSDDSSSRSSRSSSDTMDEEQGIERMREVPLHQPSEDEEEEPAPVQQGEGVDRLRANCGGTFQGDVSESTKKQRKAIMKLWVKHQEELGEEHDPDEIPILLVECEGGGAPTDVVDWGKVTDFAAYFVNTRHKGKPTFSQWKQWMDTVQYWINSNCNEYEFPEKRGIVQNHKPINAMTKNIVKKKAVTMDVEHPDIHFNLLRRTYKHQRLEFVEQCLAPTDRYVSRLNALMRTQVLVAQLATSLTLQRCEHISALTYKMSLTRPFELLGPNGTVCDVVVANKGKTNKSGHVETKALPPTM